MIKQLPVYDEHGTQIGMTFPKRARQLISKQRAVWYDDAHTAIQLVPETKIDIPLEEYLDDNMEYEAEFTQSDDLLLYLARQNVKQKRLLIKHVIAYIASWPLVSLFYESILINTAHSSYPQWRRVLQQFERVRWYLSATQVSSFEAELTRFFNNLSHPIIHVVIGAMVAWGIWILASAVKWFAARRRRRLYKTKADPVQLEYQRLKDRATMKF